MNSEESAEQRANAQCPAQDDMIKHDRLTAIETKEKRMFERNFEENGVREILESLTVEEKKMMPDGNEPLRHFRAEKGNLKKAIKKIKYALKWRKDFGVSKLTSAFYEDSSSASPDPELAAARSLLTEECRTGKLYVRGYDREGRAILYMHPRNENSTNEDHNIKNIVYNIERACSCTAKNGYEKYVIVMNGDGWTMKIAPSMKVSKEFLHILQECYPERCWKMYICNPPMVFRIFWNLVQPFVDPVTKSKVVFCSNKAGKKALDDDLDLTKVEESIGGSEELRAFDVEEYLNSPMHLSFDETLDPSPTS